MAKPAAILDIGSSKLVCLVGSIAEDGGLTVHGASVTPYPGFSEEGFGEEEVLREKVSEAVRKAEQESRIRIREVAISVPGMFTGMLLTEATRAIEGKGGRITDGDVRAILSETPADAGGEDALWMHSTPVRYTLDGSPLHDSPVGRRAKELGTVVSHMYVYRAFTEPLERALAAADTEVSMYLSQPLASALTIIPEAERDRSAILIDMGYGVTDVAVIEGSALIGLRTIAMGGKQFASDLSFGTGIPMRYAEIVKRRYVFGQEPLSPVEIVRMPEGPKRIRHKVIRLIMDARMGEFLSLLRGEMAEMGISPDDDPAVYLTGGGLTMMKGSVEYMKRTLGFTVRRDIPYLPEMDTPNYTSAFGTLDLALRTTGSLYPEAEKTGERKNEGISRVFQRIRGIYHVRTGL